MNPDRDDQPTGYDIELVPEPRLHLRAPGSGETGRVSIGAPEVRRLPPAEGADGDFYLLSLVCAFRPPADGAPLVDAAVGLRLESPGEPDDRQPIAWSISPKARRRPVQRRTTVSITAQLAIVEAGVEVAPGQGEQLFVVGTGERDSDPEWRFRAVDDHPLIGDETLDVVVRAPAGAPVVAHLMAAATIRHRRLGVLLSLIHHSEAKRRL
ncbi:hypothetical protein E1265_22785 [Streptomyces sp. 8K308]|uniref:hypothetical protein n=1 Tax=Streptomyces sp. 8K308 TaxID=2530388 RepID=UPI001048F111|nr:hypothetical protein [Streptomyces sp. 8K308]TDC20108.1 hypothetical protein E1265_22785 [Streptomyces sp. 8K308]